MITPTWIPSLGFQKKESRKKIVNMSLGAIRNSNVTDVLLLQKSPYDMEYFEVNKYIMYMFKEGTKFTEGKLNCVWLYILCSFISLIWNKFGSLFLIT